MTKNNLKYVKIECRGFQDLCRRYGELEEENKKLKEDNKILSNELTYFKEYAADLEEEVNRSSRMIQGLKLNNRNLTLERNDLLKNINIPVADIAEEFLIATKNIIKENHHAKFWGDDF